MLKSHQEEKGASPFITAPQAETPSLFTSQMYSVLTFVYPKTTTPEEMAEH